MTCEFVEYGMVQVGSRCGFDEPGHVADPGARCVIDEKSVGLEAQLYAYEKVLSNESYVVPTVELMTQVSADDGSGTCALLVTACPLTGDGVVSPEGVVNVTSYSCTPTSTEPPEVGLPAVGAV